MWGGKDGEDDSIVRGRRGGEGGTHGCPPGKYGPWVFADGPLARDSQSLGLLLRGFPSDPYAVGSKEDVGLGVVLASGVLCAALQGKALRHVSSVAPRCLAAQVTVARVFESSVLSSVTSSLVTSVSSGLIR